MLTPLDIHNKVFERAFRGYKMEEVDAFLDEVIRAHESLFRENKELKETVSRMEEEAAKSREVGAALEKTMVLAQKVFEEETLRAKKEAELILWEAEKKGEKLIQEAQREVLDIRQKIEHLRLYEKQLYLKHKGFLEFQMELLDGYNDREAVLTDSDMDKLSLGGRESHGLGEEDRGKHSLPDVVSIDKDDTVSEAAGGLVDEKEGSFAGIANGENAAAFESKPENQEAASLNQDQAEQQNPADQGTAAPEISGTTETAAEIAKDSAAAGDGGNSPFVLDKEAGGMEQSMEQVVLLAQKMEEALKALDTMYGTDENGEESL